jgi:hypothetical protein
VCAHQSQPKIRKHRIICCGLLSARFGSGPCPLKQIPGHDILHCYKAPSIVIYARACATSSTSPPLSSCCPNRLLCLCLCLCLILPAIPSPLAQRCECLGSSLLYLMLARWRRALASTCREKRTSVSTSDQRGIADYTYAWSAVSPLSACASSQPTASHRERRDNRGRLHEVFATKLRANQNMRSRPLH